MEQNIRRAREMVPAIVITVLSMIQALALELYWTRIQESEFLWNGGWEAAIGWAQLVAMLLGILQIWVMYVSLMLRFSWLPSMRDTLIPFAIGLLEFSMIDLMGPADLGVWFVLLAAVFSLSIWALHAAHKQARRDPENDYFFKNLDRASWRDYLGSLLGISVLMLIGLGLLLTDARGAWALVALVFAVSLLVYQLIQSHHYWMHTLVDDSETD